MGGREGGREWERGREGEREGADIFSLARTSPAPAIMQQHRFSFSYRETLQEAQQYTHKNEYYHDDNFLKYFSLRSLAATKEQVI